MGMQQRSRTRKEGSSTETAKIVRRAIEHGDGQPVAWIANRFCKKSNVNFSAGADGNFAGDLAIV